MSNINFDELFPTKQSLVKYIDDGNSLDIMDSEQNTLLIYICTNILQGSDDGFWNKQAMKMLELPPSQINLKYANSDGITGLILVSGVDNEVAMKMLSYGPEAVNLNSVEQNNKMNALMYGCTVDGEEVAIEMLKLPTIDISLQNVNNDGYSPLMLACENEVEEIALSMIDWFPTEKLNIFQKNNRGKNAFDLALDNEMMEVYRILGQMMNEEERNNDMYGTNNTKDKWAQGVMTDIPNYELQLIDGSKNGYDSVMLEERNVKEYIDEDKGNIVILYEGKNYLLTRSTIERQMEDGIVFECLLAGGDKSPPNIVQNLPLFNIKMIGIDIPTDKTGIWPEFIYLDGIKNIITSENQYFSVIPLLDKMLVSVISMNEAKKWGTGQGSAAGSLHCQNGQGGMAGIIVPAQDINSTRGGKKNKRTNKKTYKKSNKKTYKKSNKKSNTSKRYNKKRTNKRKI